MEDKVGWLLDVYVSGEDAILWVKVQGGSTIRLKDHFRPSFYILPKDEASGLKLYRMLINQPEVAVGWVEKYTSLKSRRRRGLIHVAASASVYRRLVRRLGELEEVKELFNTDLLHVQQYLFNRLKVEPTSKIRLTHKGDRLVSIEKLDDEKEVAPPPFTVLYFNLQPKTASPTPDPSRDPVGSIEAEYDGEKYTFEAEEAEVIQGFAEDVTAKDPDLHIPLHPLQNPRAQSSAEKGAGGDHTNL